MGIPSWLYYLFALAMLAVAGYGLVLLLVALFDDDPSGRDVDTAHVFMGMSMAGMFVPAWAFWPSGFWQLVFGALLVWFVVRTIQSIRQYGLHVPHETIHAAMSLAMLLMYWYPMSSGGGTSMGMSMGGGGSHGVLDPGIGLILVVAFCWSAIFTLASPDKGVSHHGRHRPRTVAVAIAGAPGSDGASGSDGAVGTSLLASPVVEDLTHVVMCVAMAFMLVLMR